jgi:hypothetical protein
MTKGAQNLSGRKPSYRLNALNKKTDEKTYPVGAGWKNEDGSITLVLNRFVVLPTDPEWLFTLFPTKDD